MLNTYQDQKELVEKGYAVEKVDGFLSTFKYTRKVMFENLWHRDPRVMECRGHVYDNRYGILVSAAPRKSFNYMENGNWQNRNDGDCVHVYKKINGYMACATVYEGRMIVSTTGTTTSDFAIMARQHIEKNSDAVDEVKTGHGRTSLFEIVDPSDPHIVHERSGLHFLGRRYHDSGVFYPDDVQFVGYMTFAEAKNLSTSDRGEGFMLYSDDESEACKLKTPYYIGKKKLMRMPASKVKHFFEVGDFSIYPEMWHNIAELIRKKVPVEHWASLTDQQRRVIIEEYEVQYGL